MGTDSGPTAVARTGGGNPGVQPVSGPWLFAVNCSQLHLIAVKKKKKSGNDGAWEKIAGWIKGTEGITATQGMGRGRGGRDQTEVE